MTTHMKYRTEGPRKWGQSNVRVKVELVGNADPSGAVVRRMRAFVVDLQKAGITAELQVVRVASHGVITDTA